MGFVNILCYMALQVPLMGHKEILEKYKQILETFFDAIMEEVKLDQSADFYVT